MNLIELTDNNKDANSESRTSLLPNSISIKSSTYNQNNSFKMWVNMAQQHAYADQEKSNIFSAIDDAIDHFN